MLDAQDGASDRRGTTAERTRLRVQHIFAREISPVDQVLRYPSTLAIAVMVFQLRVVTGTPKSRSNMPR
jgi:hypothetical protein